MSIDHKKQAPPTLKFFLFLNIFVLKPLVYNGCLTSSVPSSLHLRHDAVLGCLVDFYMGSFFQLFLFLHHQVNPLDPHITQTSALMGVCVFANLTFSFSCLILTAIFSLQLNRHDRGFIHPFWNMSLFLFRRWHQVWEWWRHYCHLPLMIPHSTLPHDFCITTSKPPFPDLSELFFLTKLKNTCVCGVCKRSFPLLDSGWGYLRACSRV